MNPLDFLNTATKLLINPTEADIRSAISRSYYAVFLHVREWWNTLPKFPRYESSAAHTKILDGLSNSGIETAELQAQDIRVLLRERRRADYDLKLHFNLKAGQFALAEARRLINAFDALDKEALREGITRYLERTNQLRP
jgi:hypothetical protein